MKKVIRKIFLSNKLLSKLYIVCGKKKERIKFNKFMKFCSKRICDFAIDKVDEKEIMTNVPHDTIWFYWNTGRKCLPPIAELCYKRDILLFGEKVTFLDSKSISLYCSFPDELILKHKKGIIGEAHFSDLIRLQLLIRYGGVWADSTVYFSENMPLNVYGSDLFVFKSNNNLADMANISNWFIVSKRRNIILEEVYFLLKEWWLQYNKSAGYLFFHWAFSFSSKRHINEWNKIPYIDNKLPHFIQHNLFYETYDKEALASGLSKCFCHKFTLHYDTPPEESTLYKIVNCDNILI